jgi:DNA-binding transcriptional regulator YbjK
VDRVDGRRERLLDAAIEVLGERGVRGVTHRAVDAAAGLPSGSTSNYFRTSDALLVAVVERFAARERDNADDLAVTVAPTTPAEFAEIVTAVTLNMTGKHRTLTLARYAILVEGALRPALQTQLRETGGRVDAWFANWMRTAGSDRPDLHAPIIQNYVTGLVLHQLASPDPAFDPADRIRALIAALMEESWMKKRSGRPSTASA